MVISRSEGRQNVVVKSLRDVSDANYLIIIAREGGSCSDGYNKRPNESVEVKDKRSVHRQHISSRTTGILIVDILPAIQHIGKP